MFGFADNDRGNGAADKNYDFKTRVIGGSRSPHDSVASGRRSRIVSVGTLVSKPSLKLLLRLGIRWVFFDCLPIMMFGT